MTTPESNIDATRWPQADETNHPSRLLTWKCVIGLSLFQCAIALLFSDAAAQGATELARAVTACSIPALAIWSLQSGG